MHRHATGVVVALTLSLSPLVAGCGSSAKVKDSAPAAQSLQQCRDQWHDVSESIVGLDQDTDPSALGTRWNSISATVVLYENTDTAKNCQATIEAEIKAITLLREFMSKLRPYDMEYQHDQIAAAVDLYLHDPLPAPTRNDAGKKVRPPTKAAVSAAMADLGNLAAAANQELAPGWGQLATVELTDTEAVRSALQDLDFLAQDSPNWRHCEEALQVLVAATRAQEG